MESMDTSKCASSPMHMQRRATNCEAISGSSSLGSVSLMRAMSSWGREEGGGRREEGGEGRGEEGGG
jgi:hypothetical protein